MSKNFDRIFLLWIDRLVWLILMIVMSNLAVEITGYAPGVRSDPTLDRISVNITENDEPFENLNRVHLPAKDVEMLEIETFKKIEKPNILTKDISQQSIFGVGGGGGAGGATTFFDSIFNIPIATLNAVNTLVQVIASGVQNSGKTIQSRYRQQHDTNSNILTKENGNISDLAL